MSIHMIKMMIAAVSETRLTSITDVALDSSIMFNIAKMLLLTG